MRLPGNFKHLFPTNRWLRCSLFFIRFNGILLVEMNCPQFDRGRVAVPYYSFAFNPPRPNDNPKTAVEKREINMISIR
jgi:hypothetical protein